MRIKDGFVLKEIAGVNVVVPIASQMVSFKAIISLNESGAFLWKQLESEKTEEELLKAFLSEYDIDETTALADIAEFLSNMKKADLLV